MLEHNLVLTDLKYKNVKIILMIIYILDNKLSTNKKKINKQTKMLVSK